MGGGILVHFGGVGGLLFWGSQNSKYSKCQDLSKFKFGGGGDSKCQVLSRFSFPGGVGAVFWTKYQLSQFRVNWDFEPKFQPLEVATASHIVSHILRMWRLLTRIQTKNVR